MSSEKSRKKKRLVAAEKRAVARAQSAERKHNFKQELEKAFTTAIIAAFGFLTALAWRDVISEGLSKVQVISPVQGKIITATIVTILSAFVVFLAVRLIPQD